MAAQSELYANPIEHAHASRAGWAESLVARRPQPGRLVNDPLAPARGIALGMAVSVVIWAALALTWFLHN